MSELEKNLYNRVRVPSNTRPPKKGGVYRGFSSVEDNKTGTTLYDFELIKQDIINHFHIRQGEKLSNPKFGCIVWDLLFEPFTITIQNAIIKNVTDIINYDPRVSAESIVVDVFDQGILVECTITFLPFNISDELVFRFNQGNNML